MRKRPKLLLNSRGWFRVEHWNIGVIQYVGQPDHYQRVELGPYETAEEAYGCWRGMCLTPEKREVFDGYANANSVP